MGELPLPACLMEIQIQSQYTSTLRSGPEGGAHKLMIGQKKSKASLGKLRELEDKFLAMEMVAGQDTNLFNEAVNEEMKLYENM